MAGPKRTDHSASNMAAIANILSTDTVGFSKKLKLAMADTGKPFVMGHGSGGLKGKHVGGYGRIHGLGVAPDDRGLGLHGNLGSGRKVNRFGSPAEAKETCMEACRKRCEGK